MYRVGGVIERTTSSEKSMLEKRVLTGIWPTAAMHPGHYAGASESWLTLQDEYDCFFLIADYQASRDHLDDIDGIRWFVKEVILARRAVSLDLQRSTLVVQSDIPEHAQSTSFLSMFTTLRMLQCNPTLKAETKGLDVGNPSMGLFNYPVSQIAVMLLPKDHLVSIGDDQLPHVDMTRERARRFNRSYGQVFPEPQALVERVPCLAGLDG